MRLLHAARLSRMGDAATGIDKQDEAASRFADAYGHEIVGTATDTDVSGSVSPWERPGLGPWLARAGEYDGIVASHLDRLGRNVRHLTALHEWAEDHGVALITVEPQIDWSSDVGRLIWQIMAWLAEQELAAITRRNVETQTWLRSHGYLVGAAPLGYVAVASGDHKVLAIDPETAPAVAEAARRYVSGESLSAIASWLDGAAPRPRGNPWWPATVRKVLHNPVYAGRRADGHKVPRIFPPELEAAVAAEDDRRKPSPRSAPSADGGALLQGIIRCGLCDRPMYRHKASNDRGTYFYYRCQGRTDAQPSRCRNAVRLEVADAEMHAGIEQIADIPHTEPQYIPAEGNADAIAETDADIRDLDPGADDFLAQVAALKARRDALKADPGRPARTEWTETDETIGQVWARLDTPGRRRWQADRGFVVRAKDGEVRVTREGEWSLRITGQPQRRSGARV